MAKLIHKIGADCWILSGSIFAIQIDKQNKSRPYWVSLINPFLCYHCMNVQNTGKFSLALPRITARLSLLCEFSMEVYFLPHLLCTRCKTTCYLYYFFKTVTLEHFKNIDLLFCELQNIPCIYFLVYKVKQPKRFYFFCLILYSFIIILFSSST